MGSLDRQSQYLLSGAPRLRIFFRVCEASRLMKYRFWNIGLEAKQGGELDAFGGTYDL